MRYPTLQPSGKNSRKISQKTKSQLLLPNINVGLSDEFYNRALINTEGRLRFTDGDEFSVYGLPSTDRTGGHAIPTAAIQETVYDVDALQEYINENERKLLVTCIQYSLQLCLRAQ